MPRRDAHAACKAAVETIDGQRLAVVDLCNQLRRELDASTYCLRDTNERLTRAQAELAECGLGRLRNALEVGRLRAERDELQARLDRVVEVACDAEEDDDD